MSEPVAYLLGELDPVEAAAFERAMAADAALRAEVERLRPVVTRLERAARRGVGGRPPPPPLRMPAAAPRPARRAGSSLRPLVAAACARRRCSPPASGSARCCDREPAPSAQLVAASPSATSTRRASGRVKRRPATGVDGARQRAASRPATAQFYELWLLGAGQAAGRPRLVPRRRPTGRRRCRLPLPVDPDAFQLLRPLAGARRRRPRPLRRLGAARAYRLLSARNSSSATSRPTRRRLEARGGRVRGPEAGVVGSASAGRRRGPACSRRSMKTSSKRTNESSSPRDWARAAAEQPREQREVGRAQPAQAAVALLEDRLGQRADLAAPRRRDERVGDPPVRRAAVRLAVGAGGARGAGGRRLGEERVDGEHPAHVVGDLVEQQAVERVGGDVGQPRQHALGAPARAARPRAARSRRRSRARRPARAPARSARSAASRRRRSARSRPAARSTSTGGKSSGIAAEARTCWPSSRVCS